MTKKSVKIFYENEKGIDIKNSKFIIQNSRLNRDGQKQRTKD